LKLSRLRIASSSEGKFANFSFTKKVDRKIVDKKFGMTFADFKKMQMEMKMEKND